MADQFTGTDDIGDVLELVGAVLPVYSDEMRWAMRGVLRYDEFAVRREELGRAPGETVFLPRYNDIVRGGRLTEGVPIERRNLTSSQIPLTLTEYGNAVGFTQKLTTLSYRSIVSDHAQALARDAGLVKNLEARDLLVGTGSQLFTRASATSLGDMTPEDRLDIETIRNCRELFATENAPRFYDDHYVMFVHPHQAVDLRRDPDWVDVNKYPPNSRAIYNGEIGRFEDFVFIETTYQPNGAAGTATPSYEDDLDLGDTKLYRAIAIADQAFGYVEALPIEMRMGPIEDFGRIKSLAWYGIFGYGVLEANHVLNIISA
jgi:N4-gp56 family major capsid protein